MEVPSELGPATLGTCHASCVYDWEEIWGCTREDLHGFSFFGNKRLCRASTVTRLLLLRCHRLLNNNHHQAFELHQPPPAKSICVLSTCHLAMSRPERESPRAPPPVRIHSPVAPYRNGRDPSCAELRYMYAIPYNALHLVKQLSSLRARARPRKASALRGPHAIPRLSHCCPERSFPLRLI